MRPGKNDKEVSEELSEFFSKINNTLPPLPPRSIVPSYSWPVIPREEVLKKLKQIKKPSSTVYGDVIPLTINFVTDEIATFLTPLFNKSFAEGTWPEAWRRETQTVIPKCANPTSFDELRNLSCTNLFSKLMEVFLLERLQSEVSTRSNQYGGTKGSGTNHFLIHTYHQIMSALEDNKNTVSIISIDFSKAFNRMDHGKCIQALSIKGATSEALTMVSAFLRDRTMSVKVGSTLSNLRKILGGSPQGTKLGNFLFTITIDAIEEKNHPLHLTRISQENSDVEDANILRTGLTCMTSTPYKAGTSDGVLRYLDEFGRGLSDDSVSDVSPNVDNGTGGEEDRSTWIDKFVDDVNGGQSHHILEGSAHITEKKEVRKIHAKKCQDIYETILTNSEKINMKVNPKKTKLLCISSAINYDVKSYIKKVLKWLKVTNL